MKRLFKALSFLLLFVLSVAKTFGQFVDENDCSNGIDDGGDGFIDCYDADCSGDNACTEFFFGNNVVCSDAPDVTDFAVAMQWGSDDQTANGHASPIVGDLDQDGIPEVVVNNRQNRTVTILNGEDGTTYKQLNLGWQPENVMALANVRGDDCAFIFAYEDRGNDMVMLDCELNVVWSAQVAQNAIGNPAFADFNHDGVAELYHRNEIRNAETGAVLVDGISQLNAGEDWVTDIIAASVAIDLFDQGEMVDGVACADCQGLELAAGRYIYSVNLATGNLTEIKDINDDIGINPANSNKFFPKKRGSNQWSGVSVADYNQDGNMDILMSGALGSDYSGQTTIFFWDVTNGTVDTYSDPGNNHNKGTGRLNIADLDGDGELNVNYVSNNRLYSLDENLNLLWDRVIDEVSSGFTGMTLFDFDDDGIVETVYRSEYELLIINGTNGADRITPINCVSRTQEEYPIVADVDGDGASEICVTCYTSDATGFDPYSNTIFGQVRVYEAGGSESWQPSRSVWNQTSYFNVNINDDLTVPIQQQDHAVVFSNGACTTGENRVLNTFMVQSPLLNEEGCSNYVTPDLDLGSTIAATNSLCPNVDFDITFDIGNTGDVAVSGSVPVTFYSGDPFVAGSVQLNTVIVTLVNLDLGQTVQFTETVNGVGGDFTLFIVINDAGGTPPINFSPASIPECGDETNNIGSISVESDLFTLTVEKVSDNRKCLPAGAVLPDNGEARAYYDGTLTAQSTIYLETFDDLSLNATSDDGSSTTPPSAWSRTVAASTDYAKVVDNNSNNMFGIKDTDGTVTWTSGTIDISGFTNVSVRADMFAEGPMETSGSDKDIMEVKYSVDGGAFTFLNQGNGVANFGYQQATINGLSGSTLVVQVQFDTEKNNELYYLDNVNVSGFSSSTNQFTEADGFVFEWYDAADVGLTTILHSGSTYPTMADGDYLVQGYYSLANCFSDVLPITIALDQTPDFFAHAYEVSPLTDCGVPDGEVTAFAYTFEDSPGVPGDTLTTGYTFAWTFTTGGVTTLGTAPTLSFLEADQYRVSIQENLTGCIASFDVDVRTTLVDPGDIEVVVSAIDIAVCGGTGELSAFVDDDPGAGVIPNTTDYTFEWYNGTEVKATPDHTGITYTGLVAGDYVVRAIQTSSSCPSLAVPAPVIDNSNAPTPTSSTTDNTTCNTTANGTLTADPDGAGSADPTLYTYQFFDGISTHPSNELPAAVAGVAFGSDPWIMTGLDGGDYTIIVTETATGCSTTIDDNVADNIVDPAFNFLTPIVAGEVLEVTGKGFMIMPQVLTGLQAFTISFWVYLDPANYADNHAIFNAGTNASSHMGIWTDDLLGVSFTVTSNSGGLSTVNSNFFPSGWTNITGSWDEATGRHKLFIDGVLVGDIAYAGTGGLDDAGSPMFFARDSNLGANKFEGKVDEFRVFDYAVDETTLLAAVCDPTAAANDALIYFDFNGIASSANGATVPDVSGNGNDGTLDKPGASPGAAAYIAADYDCPLAGAINNISCDAANPTGSIDMTGLVDPIGANYEYTLYTGYTTTTQIDQNTSGMFGSLSDGFYTMVVRDTDSDCDTDPLFFAIASQPDNPNIVAAITDDTSCNGAAVFTGEIAVTSFSNVSTSTYTYELFDGASFATPNGAPVVGVDGTTGHTFTGLENGTYRIRVTDETLLCDSFTDEIVGDNTATPAFTAGSATGINNTSCGVANGQVRTFIDGDDKADYIFNWYDGIIVNLGSERAESGLGNNVLSTLSAGSYTVVAIHNVSNCETALPLTVEIFDTPTNPDIVIQNVMDQTDCGSGDGSGDAYADELIDLNCPCVEADGFTFQWYVGSGILGATVPNGNGGNTSAVSGLAAGVYTVEVTDPLGCPNTEEMTIGLSRIDPVLTQNDVATANATCTPGTYTGAVTVKVEFDGEDPVADLSGYTFTWYNGSGASKTLNATSITETLSSAQDGTYSVEVAAPNSCPSELIIVTIPAALPTILPVESALVGNTVCDPTANLANPDATGTVTYTPTSNGSNDTYNFALRTSGGTAIDNANGTAGYTFVLYNNTAVANTTVTGLPVGNYIMNIVDATSGCDIDEPFAITDASVDIVLNETDIQASTTPNTTCDPNNYDGTATVDLADITLGSGAALTDYTFFWATATDPTTQIDDDNFLDGDLLGAPITGVQDGDYIVTALDNITGCPTGTPANITIGIALPALALVTNVLSDNFSCDVGSPNGSADVEINGTPGLDAAYSYEWYVGPSAVGTIIDTDNQIDNRLHGTYSVKVTNNTTTCFGVVPVVISEFAPSITITASSGNDHTSCYPSNGVAQVDTNVVNFLPAGPPIGFTGPGTFTYTWYNGAGAIAGNELVEGVNPGNLSTPTNVGTATVSGLTAGDYTVVVTETQTGCISGIEIINIPDEVLPYQPTIAFTTDIIPTSCAAENGQITATIAAIGGPNASGGGVNFTFEWYEGAQDYATLETTGSGLALEDGDPLVGNPSGANVTVNPFPSVPVGTGGATTLGNLVSGLYTLVMIDFNTSCRYFEYYELGFNGQQVTTTLTVENVTECPDNGVASVGLADNIILTITKISGGDLTVGETFTSDGGGFGIVAADNNTQLQVVLDDLSVALLATETITGSTSGETATITLVAKEGYGNGVEHFDDISQYLIYLYAGNGVPADRYAPYTFLGNVFPYVYDALNGTLEDGDGNAVLDEFGVPVRAPALNAGGVAVFPSLPSGDYIAIAQGIDDPAFNPGNPDMCWTAASIDKEVLDLAYEPITQSSTNDPNTSCDILNGNGQLSLTVIENPTENTNPAIDQQPDGYRFTWVRDANLAVVHGPVDILTETATSTTAADLNPGDYTVTIERLGGAASTPNSCEVVETFTVAHNPEQHYITNATITHNDDCDPLNGAAIINDADITEVVGNYTFTWYFDAAGTNVLDATDVPTVTFPSAANGTTGANAVATLPAGFYYVKAVHDVSTTCETPLFEVEIEEFRVDPTVEVVQTSQDVTCDDATFTPTGIATATVTNGSMTAADYTFSWFEDAGETQALDGTGVVAAPMFNGDGNEASQLPAGTYYVRVEDDVSPGDGCPSVLMPITIEQFTTTISVGATAGADFNIIHSDDCSPENGAFEILDISETRPSGTLSIGGSDFAIGDYTFDWYETDGATLITAGAFPDVTFPSAANGAAGANDITGLPAGTYFVGITNEAAAGGTGCLQSTDDYVEFIIEDNRENPIAELDTKTVSTFCNTGTPNDGNGTLNVNILEGGVDQDPPGNYTITWYRGNSTAGADEIFPVDGGSLGTATANADLTQLTGLSQGFYTVALEKTAGGSPGFGCTYETSFEIIQMQDIPTLSESNITANAIDNTICAPGYDGSFVNNGSITINDADVSTGDLGDFEITIEKTSVGSGHVRLSSVNPGVTSLTTSNLEAGEYFVSVRNTTTNCSASSVRVNILDSNPTPDVQLVSLNDNLNCAAGTDATGSITVTADGFDETNADYEFQWFLGSGTGTIIGTETSATIGNLTVNTYTLRVRNTLTGCETIREYDVEDVEDNPIILSYDARNQSFCSPNENGKFVLYEIIQTGVTLDTTAMIAEGYILEVFTNPGNISMGTSNGLDVIPPYPEYAVENLPIGSYYAVVTNNGSNCTSDRVDFEVEDNRAFPIIGITVDAEDQPCSLANGQLSATADDADDTDANYMFDWYFHDGIATRGTLIASTSTISLLEAGFYEVEVTSALTACTISQVVELTESDQTDPAISAVTAVGATICTPGDGSITVDGMNLDTPQEYVFDLYDQDPSNAGATLITTLPAGTNPVLFSALGASTYYIVATHDTRGCVTPIAREVIVEDLTTPLVIAFTDFVPNTRCDPTIPNGSLTAEADGSTSIDPVTGYTWAWTGVDQSGTAVAALPNSATITDIPAGTYDLTVTNNATGCTTTAQPYILTDESPAPLNISVSTSSNTNCVNFNGKMAATVIQPNYPLDEYDYLWFIETQVSPDLNNPDFTGSLIGDDFDVNGLPLVEDLGSGPYTLVVRDTPEVNDICQSVVIPVFIEDDTNQEFTPLVEIVSDVTYCYDDLPNGHARVTNEDLGQYSIEWFESANLISSIKTGFFVDSLTVGNYQVKMTNLISGCEYTTDFDIIDATETVPNPDVSLIANNTHCTTPNGEAIATVNGATQSILFEWFDASDVGLTTVLYTGSQQTSLDAGSYLVRATDLIFGCVSGNSSIVIETVITDPIFEVLATNSLCLRTEDGAINQFNGEAFIRFSSLNFVETATWTNLDNNEVLTYNTTGEPITQSGVSGLVPGDYSVTFTADNGCEYSSAFNINTAVQVFNFVTANGDTRNDFFLIDCLDFYPNNNVKIFTRAGQKVFEINGYNNFEKRFDGTSDRGKDLPAGTYFYIIEPEDGSELLQGYLELVR